MTKYNFTLHLKSGNRLFLMNIESQDYADIRKWLEGKETDRTFDHIFMFPYSDGNKYRKPTTYYFPPAFTFIEYYEISQV